MQNPIPGDRMHPKGSPLPSPPTAASWYRAGRRSISSTNLSTTATLFLSKACGVDFSTEERSTVGALRVPSAPRS